MNRLVLSGLLSLFLLPVISFGATLNLLSSQQNVFRVGDTISVTVSVDTKGNQINAVSGDISFDKSMVTVTSVIYKSSILNFWVNKPSYNNKTGTISFEGVALSGYQGSRGAIVTINLKALKEGDTKLAILSSSIFSNDGQGTNIFSGKNDLSIQINKALISENKVDKKTVNTQTNNVAEEKIVGSELSNEYAVNTEKITTPEDLGFFEKLTPTALVLLLIDLVLIVIIVCMGFVTYKNRKYLKMKIINSFRILHKDIDRINSKDKYEIEKDLNEIEKDLIDIP